MVEHKERGFFGNHTFKKAWYCTGKNITKSLKPNRYKNCIYAFTFIW